MAANRNIYDYRPAPTEPYPYYVDQGLSARNERERPWVDGLGQYGQASLPTSARVPTSSFTYPESKASQMQRLLNAAAYVFYNVSLIGVSRILPMTMSNRQVHYLERRYVQASALQRLPEESTPEAYSITSEMIAERSERYGAAIYSEANFDNTPEGKEVRAVFLKNFRICSEITIHCVAMLKLLSCQTLWHAFYTKECKSSFTAESIKRVLDIQRRGWGCVYDGMKFSKMVTTAINAFPQGTQPSVLITSRKAIPLLQVSAEACYFTIHPTITEFFQMKKTEHEVKTVQKWRGLEVYTDFNDENDSGPSGPDRLYRNNVYRGQYWCLECPSDSKPEEYSPNDDGIEVVNYRLPGFGRIEKLDAIEHGMPEDGALPLNDVGAFSTAGGDRLDSLTIGHYLAQEYDQLDQMRLVKNKASFIKGLKFCAEVVIHKAKKTNATAIAAVVAGVAALPGAMTVWEAAMTHHNIATTGGANAAANHARANQYFQQVFKEGWLRKPVFDPTVRSTMNIRGVTGNEPAVNFASRAQPRGGGGGGSKGGKSEKRSKKTFGRGSAAAAAAAAEDGERNHEKHRRMRRDDEEEPEQINAIRTVGRSNQDAGNNLVQYLDVTLPDIPVFVWDHLLALSIEKNVLAAYTEAGLCVPLQFYAVRPHVNFTTTSYILAVPGHETGYTWFVYDSFMQGSNAKNQTTAASFTMEFGVMVRNKENVMVLPDVELNRVVSGHGLRFAHYTDYDPAQHDVIFYATGLGDIMDNHFCIPTNGTYFTTPYMKMLGEEETPTDAGYVSPITQLLYAKQDDWKDVDGGRRWVHNIDFHRARDSVILDHLIGSRHGRGWKEAIEGTDDIGEFNEKFANSLNPLCLQGYQTSARGKKIYARGFFGSPYENPDDFGSIFHGTYMRDSDPIPIRDVSSGKH